MKTSYSGGRSPGDVSHSSRWAAISACRALRMISSRVAPGGSNSASARRRFASSERRASRDWLCSKRRRSMTPSPALRVLTVGFCSSDPNMQMPTRQFLFEPKFAASVHSCTFANAMAASFRKAARSNLIAARSPNGGCEQRWCGYGAEDSWCGFCVRWCYLLAEARRDRWFVVPCLARQRPRKCGYRFPVLRWSGHSILHPTVGRQRALRIVCLARFKARDAFSVRHLISNKSGPVAVVVGPRARAVLPYGLG
jgi:hypothetical protein